MKILQVRFKNLNSLVGEWMIDLTHPAFASDGIFAIVGPTGAGKTTILDAICLALYGKTPRLASVTKGDNEIMSRQTSECFAEVTFETQQGRFRCHWSQHRARKRKEGELQQQKHEISNADTGQVLDSSMRGVADQIEAATGMDFERFTRSMLLAQGNFTAFLKASPDGRAPILEQITGTEIYSKISKRVHERTRDEHEKLRTLEEVTKGIVILSPEQEAEKQQALADKQQQESDLSAKVEQTQKCVAWLKDIDGLKKEIAGLSEKAGVLQSEIDAFKPDRARLERAQKAALLDGIYAALSTLRRQQEADQTARKEAQERLPALEFAANDHAARLKMAERRTLDVKEELKRASPTLQTVRGLDQRLGELTKALSEDEDRCRKDEAGIDQQRQKKLKQETEKANALEMLKGVDTYLGEHAPDEWLVSGLAGVEEQLNAVRDKQDEVVRKGAAQDKAVKALEGATKSLDDSQKACDVQKNLLDKAKSELQRAKDALNQLLQDRPLREYRAEKEGLLREKALLMQIAELEDRRKQLQDGKPCPLCGATHHPFAEGNVPVPDAIEQKIELLSDRIKKAEDQEDAIKKLAEAEAGARDKLVQLEKAESTAADTKRSSEKALGDIRQDLEKLRQELGKRRQEVAAKLRALGIAQIPEGDVSPLRDSLKQRRDAWQSQVNAKSVLQRKIEQLESEIKTLEAVIETQAKTLGERREQMENRRKEVAEIGDQRKKLFGDKNLDVEERRLNEAVSAAENAEKQARDEHEKKRESFNQAKQRVESLQKLIDDREPLLKKTGIEFSGALGRYGFADEAGFREARLPPDGRDGLAARAKELEDAETNLQALRRDREERLAKEVDKKITDLSLEEVEPLLTHHKDSLKALQDEITDKKGELNRNAIAKEGLQKSLIVIEAQRKERQRWDNLDRLVGSADGKVYRNFVQGLTFDLMIGYANQQLKQMSERYLLVRNEQNPLELDVMDNDQAGEIRSTRNLSGGESFIVSLSLALGLSQMASRKVRVDSLFLDEGFGTLDEETLDTALETLASLRQEGKLIGVISHVPALKERIRNQIVVTPQSGGRSRLSGPGCSGSNSVERAS